MVNSRMDADGHGHTMTLIAARPCLAKCVGVNVGLRSSDPGASHWLAAIAAPFKFAFHCVHP